jgi:hypothetical protein
VGPNAAPDACRALLARTAYRDGVNVLGGIGSLLELLSLAALVLGVFVFVDAAIRPVAGFVAAGKLTKPAWLTITGVATLVVLVFGVLSFLGIPALVALLVYLVDVRPAVRGMSGGRPPNTSSW